MRIVNQTIKRCFVSSFAEACFCSIDRTKKTQECMFENRNIYALQFDMYNTAKALNYKYMKHQLFISYSAFNAKNPAKQ